MRSDLTSVVAAAILGGVLVAASRWLGPYLMKLGRELGQRVYIRFASSALFRPRALRVYKQSLFRTYGKLKIPFDPERRLDFGDIYVPLSFIDSQGKTIESAAATQLYRRMMIHGPPGSGKSMLLRAMLLSFAQGTRLAPNDPVPVFLNLTRLSTDGDIGRQIASSFDVHGFPNAERFVQATLRQGRLLVLFDGFDEVAPSDRPQVANLIRSFLHVWECPAVITSRSGAYLHDLTSAVEKTFEIAGLAPESVIFFLSNWELAAGQARKGAGRLVRELRERPALMAIARNPLLLTILAFLYLDAAADLPNSLPDFYHAASDLLLNQWKPEYNRFSAGVKADVLSRIALRMYDIGAQRPIGLSHLEILHIIANVLPALHFPSEDADGLLDELVSRSGLLMQSGPDEYRFLTLTMQEYFAARALASEPTEFLENLRRDPDRWRGVALFWCGMAKDATPAIQALLDRDEALAIECLAGSNVVSPETGAATVDLAKRRLTEAAEGAGPSEELARAAGRLAASRTRPGEQMYFWLASQLDSGNENFRNTAARCLTHTNLPQAEALLANRGAPELTRMLQRQEIVPQSAPASDRVAPELPGLVRRFFTEAGFSEIAPLSHDVMALGGGAFAVLWDGNRGGAALLIERNRGNDKPRVYAVYSDATPRAEEINRLRSSLRSDVVPLHAPVLSRALAEGNCRRKLAELEDPFLSRDDPYDESRPISDPAWFFGRHEALERMPKSLAQCQHVGLFGLRKVGKTSLLHMLRDKLAQSPVVWLDCQAYATNATDLLSAILEKTGVEMKRLLGAEFDPGRLRIGSPRDFAKPFLRMFEQWAIAHPAQPIVLFLDEADKLFVVDREGADGGALDEYVQFFRVLRGLAQQERCLAVVVTAYRPDVNRRNELPGNVGENPMFLAYQERFVGPLSAEETRLMLAEIGHWKGIVWEPQALDAVYDASGGHPLITRMIASDATVQGSRKRVTVATAEEAISQIRGNFHKHAAGAYYREAVWKQLSKAEQDALTTVLERRPDSAAYAGEAISNLERFGLIAREDGGFRVPAALLRDWMQGSRVI